MATHSRSRQIGERLCQALGIDASVTRKLTIIVEADNAVTVEIEKLPSPDEMDAVVDVLNEADIAVDNTSLADDERKFRVVRRAA